MTEQDGIPAALGATLFLGILAYYAYGQLRMGRFGSWWGNPWESEPYHVGAARVSGLFGLTFQGFLPGGITLEVPSPELERARDLLDEEAP